MKFRKIDSKEKEDILSYRYKDNLIEFKVILSNRKSLSIEIQEDLNIYVRAPRSLSKEVIMDIVRKKSQWIIEKRNELYNIKKIIIRKPMNGYSYLYLGEEYKIKIVHDESCKDKYIVLKNNTMYIHTNSMKEENLKLILEEWYRKETKKIIQEYIEKYKTNFKETIKEVKIKTQKKRWGSCTYDNKLLFNWKLSMAPKEVIEYVVIHELCHMKHKNHSKDYWSEVNKNMPSYKERHNWLKQNGYKLYI